MTGVQFPAGAGKGFFSLLSCKDQLCGSPTFLSIGIRDCFPGGKVARE